MTQDDRADARRTEPLRPHLDRSACRAAARRAPTPTGRGLDGLPRHRRRARRAGARDLRPLAAGDVRRRGRATSATRLADLDMTPVVSAGIDMMGPMEAAFRSAAPARRHAPSASASARSSAATATPGGAKWDALDAPHPRGADGMGPARRRRRLPLRHREPPGLHQRRAGRPSARADPRRRHHLRHRQHLPGRRGAARLHPRASRRTSRHVHLKDYRVQFTDEGYRLVRCAIGDGAVPLRRDARRSSPRRQPDADRGARARRARGAPRPALHRRLVERLRAQDRARSLPPACARRA